MTTASPDGSAADSPEGIQAGPVTSWLTERIDTLVPPVDFALITGGNSNLTFLVTDTAGGRWVLRRPPTGMVLRSAHDMGREARIISALADTPVPVPTVVDFCDDEAVNGAPFYVMDHVAGTVVDNRELAESFPQSVRARAGESLVDTLATIHAVDVDAVGLGDFGRREGYISRQLQRWFERFQKTTADDVPAMDETYRLLIDRVPVQQAGTIVHGDYRLANAMMADTGDIAAVLDWELSTLGDPLADLGMLMMYYAPNDSLTPPEMTPTSAPGFMPVEQLVERYAARSTLDLAGIDYYVSFAYFRLACIIAGVHARYVGGVMGTQGSADEFDFFAAQVRGCAHTAQHIAQRL